VTEAVAIAAGYAHNCALLKSGFVTCWGQNLEGQLGNGNKEEWSVPVITKNVSGVVAISSGVTHSCAVLRDGTIWCWGTDSFISGRGPQVTISLRSPVPVQIPKISNAVTVANGRNHTCAMLKGGGVDCWGSNVLGQIGAEISGRFTRDPVRVGGVSGAKFISTQLFMTCAVIENGGVKCWGGMDGSKPRASDLRAISKATRVAVDDEVVWILLSDGTVMHISARPSSSQALVEGVRDARDIAAGFEFACALLSGGTVVCWGENEYGQLGGGTLQGGAR
jgi:alpha-tubulin suppressor-like RCC1 family protein